MRDNSYDRTIERNYLQKWRFLIPEYEAVKAGRSELFKRVGDFYRHHGTCSQTFRKYYNRYLQSGEEADLLPRRRGPKWRERREPKGIEAEIVACRKLGMNRYEIHAVLREKRDKIPSPITIYRVLKRHQLNRRTPAMREAYVRLHELGHAHSVEAWDGDALAGGIYGVAIGRMFFGESMFSAADNGSKVALLALARALRGWGYPLLDAQVASPHLFTLGAIEIARGDFCARVGELVGLAGVDGDWRAAFPPIEPADLAA